MVTLKNARYPSKVGEIVGHTFFVTLVSLFMFLSPCWAADKEELVDSLLGPKGKPAAHLRPYFEMLQDTFCIAAFQRDVVETLPRDKAPPRRPPGFCSDLLQLVEPSLGKLRVSAVERLRPFLFNQSEEQLQILNNLLHSDQAAEFASLLRDWNFANSERAVVRYSINSIQRLKVSDAVASADAVANRWKKFQNRAMVPFGQVDQLDPELIAALTQDYAQYVSGLLSQVGFTRKAEYRQLIERWGGSR